MSALPSNVFVGNIDRETFTYTHRTHSHGARSEVYERISERGGSL